MNFDVHTDLVSGQLVCLDPGEARARPGTVLDIVRNEVGRVLVVAIRVEADSEVAPTHKVAGEVFLAYPFHHPWHPHWILRDYNDLAWRQTGIGPFWPDR